jgi:hypothetical protein
MDLKGFAADHMGHFTLYDVPNMLVALLLSALLAYLLAALGMRCTALQAVPLGGLLARAVTVASFSGSACF